MGCATCRARDHPLTLGQKLHHQSSSKQQEQIAAASCRQQQTAAGNSISSTQHTQYVLRLEPALSAGGERSIARSTPHTRHTASHILHTAQACTLRKFSHERGEKEGQHRFCITKIQVSVSLCFQSGFGRGHFTHVVNPILIPNGPFSGFSRCTWANRERLVE